MWKGSLRVFRPTLRTRRCLVFRNGTGGQRPPSASHLEVEPAGCWRVPGWLLAGLLSCLVGVPGELPEESGVNGRPEARHPGTARLCVAFPGSGRQPWGRVALRIHVSPPVSPAPSPEEARPRECAVQGERGPADSLLSVLESSSWSQICVRPCPAQPQC